MPGDKPNFFPKDSNHTDMKEVLCFLRAIGRLLLVCLAAPGGRCSRMPLHSESWPPPVWPFAHAARKIKLCANLIL